MKRFLILAAVTGLFLGSCIFKVPFVEEATVKIDLGLLGAWEEKVGEGEKSHRMVVLPFSEKEYLIHYPAAEDGIYYRAYLIEMGGKQYVQLQALGTHAGLPEKLKTPYTLARCSQLDGSLELQMIKNKVIDANIDSSTLLRESFQTHKEEELFDEPSTFLRVEDRE